MDVPILKPASDLAKFAKPPFPGESTEYHKRAKRSTRPRSNSAAT